MYGLVPTWKDRLWYVCQLSKNTRSGQAVLLEDSRYLAYKLDPYMTSEGTFARCLSRRRVEEIRDRSQKPVRPICQRNGEGLAGEVETLQWLVLVQH